MLLNKNIIVTTSWDDGHKLDLKLARLLNKYDIPATLYISPKNREFPTQDLLSITDIKSLSKSFEIGAHTMTHPRLNTICNRDIITEISESKTYLEHIIDDDVNVFCYPGGVYNSNIKEHIKKAGYLGARTTKQMIMSKPNDVFEFGTTLQAIPLTFRSMAGEFKYAVKENIKLIPSIITIDWELIAIRTFNYVLENGGVWHLWGHSWLTDKNNEWIKLENVLRYVSRRSSVIYLTNSETLHATD